MSGYVIPGAEVRAQASTDDASVDEVTFRWIDPSGDIAREVTVPISNGEDTFATYDEHYSWRVEADFHNGVVVTKTWDVTFFVLPESPIGGIAIIASSLVILALFLKLRRTPPLTGL